MKNILKVIPSKINFYKIFALKHRYLLTRQNKPRIRYALSASFAALFVFAAFQNAAVFSVESYANTAPAHALMKARDGQRPVTSVAAAQTTTERPTVYSRVLPNNIIDIVKFSGSSDSQVAEAENNGIEKFEIQSGQTIGGILQNAGISGTEAHRVVKALSEHLDMRKIRAGQVFEARFEKDDESEQKTLAEISMSLDSIKSLNVQRDGDEFVSEIKEKEIFKRTYAGTTQIQTSLYGSAARAGIPSQVVGKMIRLYSWTVDFQRDIRRDDEIQILYDVYETEDGEAVRYGDILFANLSTGGRDIPLYRFENSDGQADYYREDGQSIRKTLMRTPIDGARMSSGYGMRRHPISGYSRMHRGVDFAAPIGTPIYAAGDGVIVDIGRRGAYGNYIRIRHNNTLETAYAHMHRFASGMSKGTRVQQGQVIAYVGSTGRSTGPHLHFEVLLSGQQVNPNRVDLPTGNDLKAKDLERFKTMVREYNQKYRDALRGIRISSLDTPSTPPKSG
ncbi:MAG: peptidoglycan DD-metalloendopeptidase family protein [Alphaproteobacteria bacterium]